MDSFDEARAVFSRIELVDPHNAHKIVAHILLQDNSETELIRLAKGPDRLIFSAIAKAKAELGLSSPAALDSSSKLQVSVPSAIHNPPSPSIWSNNLPFSPDANYARSSAIHNPQSPSTWSNNLPLSPGANHTRSSAIHNPQSPSIWSNNLPLSPGANYTRSSFLEPSSKSSHFPEMSSEPGPSTSTSLFAINDPDSRGLEGSSVDPFEHYRQQLILSEAAKQRSLASAQHRFRVNSPQRSEAEALMMDKFQKLNLLPKDGTDNSEMACRKIYLTFQAESTFTEEDLVNYFRVYGAVQNVYIPCQGHERMYGFVTFVFPETAQIVLKEPNPHFVSDCRVLVKPYLDKVKGTHIKKHQLDRHDLLSSSSSSSLLGNKSFQMPVGPRLLHNNQNILNIKLEKDLHYWEQWQGSRLMKMQPEGLKNYHIYRHDFSHTSPSHLADNHETLLSQNVLPATDGFPAGALEENEASLTAFAAKEPQEEVSVDSDSGNNNAKDDAKFNLSNERAEESRSPEKP